MTKLSNTNSSSLIEYQLCNTDYSLQINNTPNNDFETKGKHLYNENNNYKLIANMMENPESREFIDSFLNDKTDVMLILVYINLYKLVESKIPDSSGYTKIAMVHEIMKNRELRGLACKAASDTFSSDTLSNKLIFKKL